MELVITEKEKEDLEEKEKEEKEDLEEKENLEEKDEVSEAKEISQVQEEIKEVAQEIKDAVIQERTFESFCDSCETDFVAKANNSSQMRPSILHANRGPGLGLASNDHNRNVGMSAMARISQPLAASHSHLQSLPKPRTQMLNQQQILMQHMQQPKRSFMMSMRGPVMGRLGNR
tara:strand:- start:1142 stop:1663 length:522 start_codon:yes stop_codon:yes gene_type:complete